jgi:hypothetical protein
LASCTESGVRLLRRPAVDDSASLRKSCAAGPENAHKLTVAGLRGHRRARRTCRSLRRAIPIIANAARLDQRPRGADRKQRSVYGRTWQMRDACPVNNADRATFEEGDRHGLPLCPPLRRPPVPLNSSKGGSLGETEEPSQVGGAATTGEARADRLSRRPAPGP